MVRQVWDISGSNDIGCNMQSKHGEKQVFMLARWMRWERALFSVEVWAGTGDGIIIIQSPGLSQEVSKTSQKLLHTKYVSTTKFVQCWVCCRDVWNVLAEIDITVLGQIIQLNTITAVQITLFRVGTSSTLSQLYKSHIVYGRDQLNTITAVQITLFRVGTSSTLSQLYKSHCLEWGQVQHYHISTNHIF